MITKNHLLQNRISDNGQGNKNKGGANFIWKRLFTGTVPVNKAYLTGTVSVNKVYLTGTLFLSFTW